MENFKERIGNNVERNNFTNKIEIITGKNIPEINISEKNILELKKEIDNFFDKRWDSTKGKIQIGFFLNKEELENFALEKNIPLEKLTKDSALFYINPNTQESYVLINTESVKKMCESMRYSEDEEVDFMKRSILAGIAHEMTHMHPFFKNHGNQGTENLWEQEMVCGYIESKIRGDISEILREWGYLNKEKIEKFSFEDGNWESFLKEEKNAVADYFYPFLIKEYGLNSVRKIWEKLQINPDIERAIEETIRINPEEIVKKFKEKIKDENYLKNILD